MTDPATTSRSAAAEDLHVPRPPPLRASLFSGKQGMKYIPNNNCKITYFKMV